MLLKSNSKKNIPKEKPEKKQPVENKFKIHFISTTQETVPYRNAYPTGIIESDRMLFTKAYKLEDVNFRTAQDETQKRIFERFQKFLNLFSANNRLQIIISNSNIDEKAVMDTILCKKNPDGLDEYRDDLNDILTRKMSEGRNNLISEKYLVVGEKAKDIETATSAFSTRLDSVIAEQFKAITERQSHAIKPMKLAERLKQMHDIYNIGNEDSLHAEFDLDHYLSQGMSTKDIIAPNGMKFYSDYFLLNDKFGRVVYLKDIPSIHSTEFMAEISDLPFNLTASVYLEPLDQRKGISIVRNNMVTINNNMIEAQKRASKAGYNNNLVSPELTHAQEQATYLMEDIRQSNQKLFYMTVAIAHYADSLNELNEDTESIVSLGNRYLCAINKLYFQQEAGFNSVLPLCNNQLAINRMMKTESAALFIPFSSQEISQKGGMYYGQNALSHNLLMINRTGKEVKNPNGLILGLPGSGKSMYAKFEMVSVLLTKGKNNEVYVLDPEAEYVPLAKALESIGSTIVHLEPGSGVYINPFDMDMDYALSDEGHSDPVTLKSDYICMLCDTARNGRFGLTNSEKSIIDRCVRRLYKPYIEHMQTVGKDITIDTDATPTMNDFYDMLMEQPEAEAAEIALALEIYCTGSFDTFAGHTNVNVNNRFVVYDIKDIGTGMKELGLQVCLNHVWNKTISNKKKGIRTWFYIDEFHILTKSEVSSNFLMQIWKRARKWDGVPTAITQNTEDLLKTEASRAIINNCEFVTMFAQSQMDRELLRELYKISDAQMEYITNSPSGQGLIYNGQTIIPFVNDIPSDSRLYKLLTTRPDDTRVA